MNHESDDDSGNLVIKELFEKYTRHWKLFLISFGIAFALGYLHLRYTPKTYRVTSSILIKTEDQKGLGEFANLGSLSMLKNNNKEVLNEIEILKSRPLMENVVRKLGLNITYACKTKFSKRLIELTDNVPIAITFLDNAYYEKASNFIVQINENRAYTILDPEENFIQSGRFGECISTVLSDMIITPNDIVLSKFIGSKIYVNVSPLLDVVERYKSTIKIGLTDKNTNVVTLTMNTIAKKRAMIILDQLIEEYNIDVINDKNKISENTARFVKERIEIISTDLVALEKGVEAFKTQNNLTRLPEEAAMMLSNSSENEKAVLETSIQIGLIDFTMEYLNKPEIDLLPANMGFKDPNTGLLINKYNEIALQRNRISNSSNAQNPLLITINAKLNSIKESLEQSLITSKKSLTIRLTDLKQRDAYVNSKIAALPTKERKLHDLKRQQEIKETLFIYLLEKREETAISLAATVSNAKVIEKSYSSRSSISPKKNKIFLSAFLAGLIIPILIIFIKDVLDTKVHDINTVKKKLQIPIIGDIPRSKEKSLVTTGADRSSLAESFRLLEININFMLDNPKEKGQTILITSTIKGEGKSFIASNLAITLGRSEKKIALLEMDLRSSALRKYLNVYSPKGITHYIKDKTVQLSDMIVNLPDFPSLDIITSGPSPPNPAELLKHHRVADFFKLLKTSYDYIIIDTPPVSQVADTLLLSTYAQLCLYVLRFNYSDKRLLEIPKGLYTDQRFSKMGLLINDVDHKKAYGYGYGYGYGDAPKPKSRWFKK